MPNLFTSLGRAALVALGLSIAPLALAQGTLSCPTGFTPLVNGNEVTCQMACATGTPTPTINGSSVSFTCSTVGGDAAPGGCTLTSSSGTTIPPGGSTTLTAKCTTGTPTDLNLTWTIPSGTANCPTTGTVNQNATCQVTGIQQAGNWSVKFGNGVGSDVTRTLGYGMQQGGGGEYAACPSNTAKSTSFYPASNTTTSTIGELNDNSTMVIKFTVPSSAFGNNNSASFSTQYSGDKTRDYVLSTTACDWNGTNAVKYNGSPIVGQAWTNLTFKYSYGAAGSTATLIRGQTYYLSIRGVPGGGCPSGDCPYGPVNFK